MDDWVAAKNYRSYYWKNGMLQVKNGIRMLWFGVFLNRGHPSRWKR